MKKLLFISILALLPFLASAQKIDYRIIDDFTGKTVIRTEWTDFDAKVQFDSKLGGRKTFSSKFMLRYEDDKIFFHQKWIEGPKTVRKGSEIQLKLKDGRILNLIAIDDFVADTDVYTSLGSNYSQNIIHAVYEGDLSQLSELNLPEKLRISSVYGSEVFDIDSKNARRLVKAYKVISDEIKKSESK